MSGNRGQDHGGLSWELEPSHFPAPVTRWTAEFYCTRMSASIRDIAVKYGLLLDGIAFREFDGRVYTAIVPLGGKPRRPPPAFLVPVLCKVVPELHRRIKRARRAEASGEFDRIVDDWLGQGEERMLGEGLDLIGRPLADASDSELADTLDAAADLLTRGIAQHFLLHACGLLGVGILGHELTTKHGWTGAEYTELFTGLSSTTTGPAGAQREILRLIAAADGRSRLMAAASLDDVRAIGSAIAQAVDDYMATWGQRAIRYEIAYPTIAERPEWLVRALQEQSWRDDGTASAERHVQTRAAREKALLVTLGDTEDTRLRLQRAQRVFPLREGNETATVGVPVGALRRVGLAIGERLVGRGQIERVDDVFDLELREVGALLRALPVAPVEPAALAAQRREDRLAASRGEAPLLIGPPPPPPPDLRGFPADVARNIDALLWFVGHAFGDQHVHPAGEDVRGEGVSPGVYEGPARVILDESAFDRIQAGDVLVCPITSPVWSMVFPYIGALVCDAGGLMSHPAIIAREFGIPGVVGTTNATRALRDGQLVRVDGSAGTVTALPADSVALA